MHISFATLYSTIKTEKYIRKAAFMNLSKSLDGAIKRCKGDMHAKPF
jgi:hypothetical protein